MKRLIDLFPSYYKASEEFVAIQEAFQPEVDAVLAAGEDYAAQLCVDTATWGLQYWEAALGLTGSGDIDTRRGRIRARLLGSGTITVDVVRDVVAGFFGGDVDVSEDARNASIIIMLTGLATALGDFRGLNEALQEIMPAHIAWRYVQRHQESTIRLYAGISVRMGKMVRVECEIPADLKFSYVTDEGGNLLADEIWQKIIDEE